MYAISSLVKPYFLYRAESVQTIVELELGAGLGNLKIEDFVQFVLREEDDGFLGGLEDGLVGLYIAHLRVFLTYGPAEEPSEVLVDFFG